MFTENGNRSIVLGIASVCFSVGLTSHVFADQVGCCGEATSGIEVVGFGVLVDDSAIMGDGNYDDDFATAHTVVLHEGNESGCCATEYPAMYVGYGEYVRYEVNELHVTEGTVSYEYELSPAVVATPIESMLGEETTCEGVVPDDNDATYAGSVYEVNVYEVQSYGDVTDEYAVPTATQCCNAIVDGGLIVGDAVPTATYDTESHLGVESEIDGVIPSIIEVDPQIKEVPSGVPTNEGTGEPL